MLRDIFNRRDPAPAAIPTSEQRLQNFADKNLREIVEASAAIRKKEAT